MKFYLEFLIVALLSCLDFSPLVCASAKESPACILKSRREQCRAADTPSAAKTSTREADDYDERRIIAIGDVHGSYSGLLDNLYGANITVAKDICQWKPQAGKGTVLIQMGDIVDRGPEAPEAWNCLRSLQKEANSYNSKVVRLFGSKIIILHETLAYISGTRG